jgi:hypothetical protein
MVVAGTYRNNTDFAITMLYPDLHDTLAPWPVHVEAVLELVVQKFQIRKIRGIFLVVGKARPHVDDGLAIRVVANASGNMCQITGCERSTKGYDTVRNESAAICFFGGEEERLQGDARVRPDRCCAT